MYVLYLYKIPRKLTEGCWMSVTWFCNLILMILFVGMHELKYSSGVQLPNARYEVSHAIARGFQYSHNNPHIGRIHLKYPGLNSQAVILRIEINALPINCPRCVLNSWLRHTDFVTIALIIIHRY